MWDVCRHLILPAVTLGLLVIGVFIRLVRVNVGQALGGDYVEAARARGVPERRVVSRHAFRNALIPVVTVMGLQAALLLGGAVLTEQTFSWPGLGSRLLQYLNNRDYIGVQGLITFFALIVVVISLDHRHRQRPDRPAGEVLGDDRHHHGHRLRGQGAASSSRRAAATSSRKIARPYKQSHGVQRFMLVTGTIVSILLILLAIFAPLDRAVQLRHLQGRRRASSRARASRRTATTGARRSRAST